MKRDAHAARGEVRQREPTTNAPAGAAGAAERKRRGRRGQLRRNCSAGVDDPGALRRNRRTRERASRADERALERVGAERRTRLSDERSGAGNRCRRRARSVHGDEARRAVGIRARIRCRETDTGCDELGLHATVVRKPRGGEARDTFVRDVRDGVDVAERDRGDVAGGEPPEDRARDRVRDRDDRYRGSFVKAEAARGERRPQAVQEDGRRACRRCPLGSRRRRGATRYERRTTGDEARARAGEEIGEPRRGPPRSAAAGARRRNLELEPPRGSRGAGDGDGLVENRLQAAAGAGDVAVCRRSCAVVARGCDDERAERRRRGDRLRFRRIVEAGERLGEREQRDPCRIVRVAVVVRIHRALEPGDDLVSARVDRPVPERIGLPAGDPDRQDGSSRRDARQSSGTAAADEQAGHLGPVTLELARVVGPRPRERARIAARDVDPAQHAAAQIRHGRVDTRVEERNRHASAVETGHADVRLMTGLRPIVGPSQNLRRDRRGIRDTYRVDAGDVLVRLDDRERARIEQH